MLVAVDNNLARDIFAILRSGKTMLRVNCVAKDITSLCDKVMFGDINEEY